MFKPRVETWRIADADTELTLIRTIPRFRFHGKPTIDVNGRIGTSTVSLTATGSEVLNPATVATLLRHVRDIAQSA